MGKMRQLRQSPYSRTNSDVSAMGPIDMISDSEDADGSEHQGILDNFDRLAARFRHVSVRVGASSAEQASCLTEILQFMVVEENYNVVWQHDRIPALLRFAVQSIQAGEERGVKVAVAILYRVSLDTKRNACLREVTIMQTLLKLAERGNARSRDGNATAVRRTALPVRSQSASSNSPARKRQACNFNGEDITHCVCGETQASEFYRKNLCWVDSVSTISLIILRRIKDEETRSSPIEVKTYARLAEQEGLCFRRVENQTAENALRLFLLLELIDDIDTLQSLAFDSYIFVAILRASDRRNMAFLSELIEKTLRILTLMASEETQWSKWEALVKTFLKILFDLPGSSFLWARSTTKDIQDDEQAIRLLALGVLASVCEESVAGAQAVADFTVTHKVPQKKNSQDTRMLEVLSDCFLLLEAKDPSETKHFTTKDHYTSVTKCTLAVVLAHMCNGLDGYKRLLLRGCTAASFLEALRLFLVVLQKADLLQDDAVLRIDNAMERWKAYEKGITPQTDKKSEAKKSAPKSCMLRFSPQSAASAATTSTATASIATVPAPRVAPSVPIIPKKDDIIPVKETPVPRQDSMPLPVTIARRAKGARTAAAESPRLLRRKSAAAPRAIQSLTCNTPRSKVSTRLDGRLVLRRELKTLAPYKN